MRPVRNFVIVTAIVFVAYFVAGKIGQATTHIRSSNLGPVWPAYGIALAAVVLYGRRAWLGIISSAFVVALSSPVSALTAAGQAAGAMLAAGAGGYLLRAMRFDRSLSRLRDALSLIVFGALASATVSATIGVSVLYATGAQAYTGIRAAWLVYWLGDSTGVLLITPLVLTVWTLWANRTRIRVVEFSGLLLLLTLACFLIFGDLAVFQVSLHVLAFTLLPFVMWAAIRFGVFGVALSTLLIAAIATVETALGSGPFSQGTTFTNAMLLDVFFAALSVSGLTLAAVIAERERAELDRAQLLREQAVLEAIRESEKKAEQQTAALRDELVHLGRVTMLDALSGSIAHEINQPLTAVMANTAAALRMLSTSPTPLGELHETLRDIQSDNERAGDVVRRVRTLMKKTPTQSEPVEIAASVTNVVKIIRGNAAGRHIVVDVELADDLPPIIGDRVRFQQVVLNLLMNACDAVESQDPPRRRVSLTTARSNGFAIVKVTDWGGGLPEPELALIFEPFYTTKHEGMGLGLSICRAIVAAHGGTLDAARHQDGMTFTATFPIAVTS